MGSKRARSASGSDDYLGIRSTPPSRPRRSGENMNGFGSPIPSAWPESPIISTRTSSHAYSNDQELDAFFTNHTEYDALHLVALYQRLEQQLSEAVLQPLLDSGLVVSKLSKLSCQEICELGARVRTSYQSRTGPARMDSDSSTTTLEYSILAERTKSLPDSSQSLRTQQRPFPCYWCDRNLKMHHHRQQHIDHKHKEYGWLSCPHNSCRAWKKVYTTKEFQKHHDDTHKDCAHMNAYIEKQKLSSYTEEKELCACVYCFTIFKGKQAHLLMKEHIAVDHRKDLMQTHFHYHRVIQALLSEVKLPHPVVGREWNPTREDIGSGDWAELMKLLQCGPYTDEGKEHITQLATKLGRVRSLPAPPLREFLPQVPSQQPPPQSSSSYLSLDNFGFPYYGSPTHINSDGSFEVLGEADLSQFDGTANPGGPLLDDSQ